MQWLDISLKIMEENLFLSLYPQDIVYNFTKVFAEFKIVFTAFLSSAIF